MDKLNNIKNIFIALLLFLSISMAFITILGKNENTKYKLYKNTFPAIKIINIYDVITYNDKTNFFIKELKSAEKSNNIKAVILRINSPGGTVGASQLIYDKIIKFKEKTKKPVFAVFGDVAASGGYYIAMAADEIFAQPGTITGSIGVIIMGMSFEELFKKVGINQEIIKSGEFKDIFSSFGTRQTEKEKKLLQEIVNKTYNQFYNVVKIGRKNKVKPNNLKKYTDGRIFNGEMAKELGFVDSIGGIDEAVDKIKKLLKIKYEINLIKPGNNILDKLKDYFIYKKTINISDLFIKNQGIPLYIYAGISTK